ncbi:unnamed protein product [Prorocentrum cordatum]|uniref:Dynein regulatory complex protein 10 n=1 Tax=Prorocentrum cordatum TaxID=2364126 RepID=A0ABN9TRJ6_9DINO|nr:unnamed protein product [Polarella glacialis]
MARRYPPPSLSLPRPPSPCRGNEARLRGRRAPPRRRGAPPGSGRAPLAGRLPRLRRHEVAQGREGRRAAQVGGEPAEADEKNEQKAYDKYACWCETITAKKATAITEAKATMRELGQEILTLKGKVATLTAEIQQLLADMAANEAAQKEATEIRSRENAAFQAETTELKQTLAALEKCIAVLVAATMPAGGPEAALLQQASRAQLAGRHLKDAIAAAPVGALSAVAPSRLSLLRSYAEQLSQGKAGYTPQSLTIQGILKEMYATFASDLESSMEDEAQKNTLFEALIATKQKEMVDMQASVKEKSAQKAEAEVMLAEATQAYDDTEAQLNHDVEFFDATKQACTTTAGDWSDRRALREEELAGVKKAIELLDSDDARTLFDTAIQDGHQGGHAASFVQISSDVGSPARLAFGALRAKAASAGSLRLARVAVRVAQAKAGHFDEVIKAIDEMIQEIDITEEQEDEKKIDQCNNEYAKINGTMADLSWKISKNEAKIAKLTVLIEDMEKELAETVESIADTHKMVEDLNATRAQENQDFLQAKTDDEDAIDLLSQARDALAKYYSNQSVDGMEVVTAGGEGRTVLLQEEPAAGPAFDVSEEQAPEVKFSGKGMRKVQAKGILAILSDIIEDLQGEIALGKKQEEVAQLEHEKQVAAAHALIESLEERKVNLETDIENKKEAKVEEEQAMATNKDDLQAEKDYLKDIKPDCDWIINNAPERRAKRRAELDGLNAAKAYLVGYKENSELGAGVAASQAGLLQGARLRARR